jgi:hypothetical protein
MIFLVAPASVDQREIDASLAIGLEKLLQLQSFDLVLTIHVNAALTKKVDVIVGFARDQVLSFLSALPARDRGLTKLGITCQLSFEGDPHLLKQNDSGAYFNELQSVLFEGLDQTYEAGHYASLKSHAVRFSFYHGDTMSRLCTNPISKPEMILRNINAAHVFPALPRETVATSVNLEWDPRLLHPGNTLSVVE